MKSLSLVLIALFAFSAFAEEGAPPAAAPETPAVTEGAPTPNQSEEKPAKKAKKKKKKSKKSEAHSH